MAQQTSQGNGKPTALPPQHQDQQPGRQAPMRPQPETSGAGTHASGKLEGKVALVTGGDSGIGRAVAVAFAREGADIAIAYLSEHEDADTTKRQVEETGRHCLTIAGDLGDEAFCRQVVDRTIQTLGRLNILVNNAGEQHPQSSLEDLSAEQLERTFRTDIFAQFYLTKAALPHLDAGSAIINTASVTAYRGSPDLLDYAAAKGAIVAFTRSLAINLADRGIRVNGVAPGPIWTPLIPSTYSKERVERFGQDTPLKRPGQPEEVAPCYVFLASGDATYMTGQMLHPDGGGFVSS